MTAKIYEFKPKAAKKEVVSVEERTNHEIFADVLDDVLGEWQEAALKDKLNEYIYSKIPKKKRTLILDYINDLNALSRVEMSLEMKVAIFYPACMRQSQIGWLAGFHRGSEVFGTPPDMASEAYARAMNIVLFVSFEKMLKTLRRN